MHANTRDRPLELRALEPRDLQLLVCAAHRSRAVTNVGTASPPCAASRLRSGGALGSRRSQCDDLVEAPRPERREMRTLSPEQARQFLDAARGHRLEVLFVLAISTGLRQGELLGLRWRDIDLDRHSMRVTGSLQQRPHNVRKSLRRRRHGHAARSSSAMSPSWHCVAPISSISRSPAQGSNWDDRDFRVRQSARSAALAEERGASVSGPARTSRSSANPVPRPAAHDRHLAARRRCTPRRSSRRCSATQASASRSICIATQPRRCISKRRRR